MAEYKAKLLRGLFTQAKNVLLSKGITAEDLGTYDLLASSTSSTSEQKNVTDITGYRYLLCFLEDGGIRGLTIMVPVGIFKSEGVMVATYSALEGGTTKVYSGVVVYNSDTSLNMYRNTTGQTLRLYGIK